MLVNTYFEDKVEQILDITRRVCEALNRARLRYQVVGGLAVFLHVDHEDPLKARLTRDVDVAVERSQLGAIEAALAQFGFEHRHAAGTDMFVYAAAPKARSAVHILFASEKVVPEYAEPVPFSDPVAMPGGILIAPVADLVRMKLTSFRLKDKVHIQDLDSVGLITPEIETVLPDLLRQRLQEVRASA